MSVVSDVLFISEKMQCKKGIIFKKINHFNNHVIFFQWVEIVASFSRQNQPNWQVGLKDIISLNSSFSNDAKIASY